MITITVIPIWSDHCKVKRGMILSCLLSYNILYISKYTKSLIYMSCLPSYISVSYPIFSFFNCLYFFIPHNRKQAKLCNPTCRKSIELHHWPYCNFRWWEGKTTFVKHQIPRYQERKWRRKSHINKALLNHTRTSK